MYIKTDYTFEGLKAMAWCGAVDTLNTIEENEKEDEFMDLLEQIFGGEIPEDVQVNDLLRFDSDYLFDLLGIVE